MCHVGNESVTIMREYLKVLSSETVICKSSNNTNKYFPLSVFIQVASPFLEVRHVTSAGGEERRH